MGVISDRIADEKPKPDLESDGDREPPECMHDIAIKSRFSAGP